MHVLYCRSKKNRDRIACLSMQTPPVHCVLEYCSTFSFTLATESRNQFKMSDSIHVAHSKLYALCIRLCAVAVFPVAICDQRICCSPLPERPYMENVLSCTSDVSNSMGCRQEFNYNNVVWLFLIFSVISPKTNSVC